MWSPISSQGPNMTNRGIWPIWGWSTDPEPTTPACPPFIFWPLWLHFSRFRASWAFRPFPRGVCQLSGGESWCTDASRAPPNPQHLLPFVILLGKWYWLTSAIGFQCTQTFHIPAASEFPKNSIRTPLEDFPYFIDSGCTQACRKVVDYLTRCINQMKGALDGENIEIILRHRGF